MRILYIQEFFFFFRVVKHFEKTQENKPIEVNFEDVKYGGRLWRYWMTQEENANFKRDITNRVKEVINQNTN